MHWIQLTQANTGVRIHVNMDLVVMVVPNRRGGANLMLTVREPAQKTGQDSARIIPVQETAADIMAMLASPR
jgi:hypothetical protein